MDLNAATGSLSASPSIDRPGRNVADGMCAGQHASIVWHLGGKLNREALETALHTLFDNHDAFRLVKRAGVLEPLHAEPMQIVLHFADVSKSRDGSSQLATTLDEFRAREFADDASLARALLVRFSEDEHVLCVVIHPSICDGWSQGVLCEDLAVLYREKVGANSAAAKSVESPQPPNAPQFRQFLKNAPALASDDAAWWGQQFSGGVPCLNLPADIAAARDIAGLAHVREIINADEVRILRAFAAKAGASLSTALATAFAAAMARIANADEAVVGLVAAAQLDADNERLVGQCARILPVRFETDHSQTLPKLCAQGHRAIMDAFEHQNGIAVGDNAAPSIVFNLDPDPNNRATVLEGLATKIEVTPGLRAGFAVWLNVTTDADRLLCDLYFDANLYSANTATRWVNLFRNAALNAAKNPDAKFADAVIATDADFAQIKAWNDTRVAYPKISFVHELVEAQVKRTPDAIAVEFFDEQLSYAALNTRANQLARHLRKCGVGPDSRVAICVDRGIPMVIGLLAILKAGGAYVPLDPAYPDERLAYMIKHGAPQVLLTEAPLAARVSQMAAGLNNLVVLDLIGDDAQWKSLPTTDLEVASTDTNNLAYVIYTSGSTGEPKGVAMPHRALVNLLQWQIAQPDFCKWRRTTQFAALGFDVAFQEVFSTLCSGGELVMLREDIRLNPEALFGFMVEKKVERLFLPFVALQLLAEGYEAYVQKNGAPEIALKEIITAGEQLRIEPRITRLFQGLDHCALLNHYGPTESHVVTSYRMSDDIQAWSVLPPIGKPIANSSIYILDEHLRPVPIGVAGELYIGGTCVARGYLGRDALTAERFVADPFATDGKMYKTGDLARWRTDGEIDYLGRNDFQIKIRGYRVELGEIESRLAEANGVKDVAVIAREDTPGLKRLVAYYTSKPKAAGMESGAIENIRSFLIGRVPEYMLPAAYVWLKQMPVTPNGKLDRRGLPAPSIARPELSVPYQTPLDGDEEACATAFAAVLELDKVGRLDNFFELGGNSLLAMRALAHIKSLIAIELSAPTIFAHPTPEALAAQIAQRRDPGQADAPLTTWLRDAGKKSAATPNEAIAVIGMAGRFPGANSVEALWDNLIANRDSITKFTNDTLDPAVRASLREDPNYVFARGVMENVEEFDAAFFGISAREAEVLDPQQRIFLEIAWECLERAGYAPDRTPGSVGVFAGVHSTNYLQHHVMAHPDVVERIGDFQVMVGNEKDYVATRVAYKLNLKGPAFTVNTACSTSLVAVAQAVDQLRAGRCDMALAGAAAVTAPYRAGYVYQEGAMLSADGRTRTFDASATGTVFSDGAAVVLLKRLPDAIADGDQIFAVIRGAAVNNDGGGKASFSAPSVQGQAAVIAAAHADANVNPKSISYVEAHGTATPLGDPVEIEALATAFKYGMSTHGAAEENANAFCRIGSVKSNVGHLVAAAGATGLIKAALSLRNEVIPATIHFDAPNPKIGFDKTPFTVNSRNSEWKRAEQPRLAGVSSFGVGGTNAHVVIEEAPLLEPSSPTAGAQLLRLSARTPQALEHATKLLADHLSQSSAANLADIAWTLDVGRSRFAHRLVVSAESVDEAASALRDRANKFRSQRTVGVAAPKIAFVFPGQGAQYAGMGRQLYERDEDFRNAFDECLAAMKGATKFDLKQRLFDGSADSLTATEVTQPATFCLEYSLAKMWMQRGVVPAMLIGHSVGEFVAAVLAGVMSLTDAAMLVAQRGALLQSMPAGGMLSVRMAAATLEARMPADLSLAAENGPTACVVAGPKPALEKFAALLEAEGVVCKSLHTSHAFHSAMMDPAVAPFRKLVSAIKLSPPQKPIMSTLTGLRMRDDEAVSVDYWARHLRAPVRFSPAVRAALADGKQALCFLEIGPRATLSTLIRQHGSGGVVPTAVASLGDTPESEDLNVTFALGQLWTLGLEINIKKSTAKRQRVLLPTYPFERKRFWLDAKPANALPPAMPSAQNISVNSVIPSLEQQPMSTPSTNASRKPQLVEKVRTLFEDVAGMDLSAADASASFIELGLDSLMLTQAAIQLKKSFDCKVTFRQLMEQYRSFDAVAEYLDATLPQDKAAPAAVASAAPAAAPTPATSAAPVASVPAFAPAMMPMMNFAATAAPTSAIQQVIQQQMALMSQQLALLSGGAAVAVPQAAMQVAAAAEAAPAPTVAAQPTAAVAADTEEKVAPVTYDVKKAFGAIARIDTQRNQLTELQSARLDAFVRRYTEKTKSSKAYTVAHRAHLADPRVVNNFRPQTKEIIYQVVVDRSKGSRVWDIDGNEYVDALNGFGMSLFGWQPDFIQHAIRKQLDTGYEIGPMHPLAGEVAKLICELTGFDRAGLCNTGSEAVMAAIRIARTVTGRSLMITFAGSYHGTFDEVIVRAGRKNKGIPAAPGIMPEAFGNVMVLEYGTPESLEIIRQHADELAAVLVEPVQSRRADFQPKEFLREVRAITEKSGTCLIFDEVITGFRSHPGGVQALFGIRADLATYGKVIGGGYPIGAVAGKKEFMDALDGGAWQYGDDSIPTVGVTYFAGTFVRHPLALAAGKAALMHMKEAGPELQSQLNLRTAAMADELNAFCVEVGAPISIKNFASLWRTSFTEDHPLQDLLFAMMRSRGVHILDNFPCFFTTAHTAEDVAVIKTAFKESVLELQAADLLPKRKDDTNKALDASKPPAPGARIGKDPDGRPAWFVPNPAAPGKYLRLDS